MTPPGSLSFPDPPRSDLDRVLGELGALAGDVLTTESRLRALLRANESIVQQLELPVVLQRIIEVAVDLVGAEYGALGVIASHGKLEQFIHVGISPERAKIIGHLPEGHGLLGALIKDPHAIRLPELSKDSRSVGFPAGHPPMGSFLGVPVRVGDEVYGNLYLTNHASGEFTADDEQLVTALAATAGHAINNARLFAEVERRQAWAAASADITASLLSSERTDSMALLASRVLALADAHLVRIAVPTGDPERLLIATARGADGPSLEGELIAAHGSIVGSVLERGEPLIVAEAEAHETFAESSEPLGPTLVVPLRASGQSLGVMVVSRVPGAQPFTVADLEMAADFAGQGSLSMELARARADQQRGLLLEDRGRIARDLHDHVIQQLFAAGLSLQGVIGATGNATVDATVDGAVSMLDVAIAQIRTAVFALEGSRAGRETSVRYRTVEVVSELGDAFAITPHMIFVGPVDIAITGGLADDVVAVVREGLTNVSRHASATDVSLTLTVGDARVTVLITDDGVGLTESTRRSGIANLETRASLRGGDCSLSSDDESTRLRWSVPLVAEAL